MSKELTYVYNLSIDKDVLKKLPDSLKMKILDKILINSNTNPCLQYFIINYIGNTLQKLGNNNSALCIYNRTLKSLINEVPSELCRENFRYKIIKAIDTIGLNHCSFAGKCKSKCSERFRIKEDFLNNITPKIKKTLFDKAVDHFIDEGNPCFISYTLLYLLEFFKEYNMDNKANDLEVVIYDFVKTIPNTKCRSRLRKTINQLNNRDKIYSYKSEQNSSISFREVDDIPDLNSL